MMTNNDVEITWKSVDGLSENEVQQKIDGAFDILFEEVTLKDSSPCASMEICPYL